MSDEEASVNRVRDQIMRASPAHAGLVQARDQIVEKWCQDHGKAKSSLTIEDILAIRALPEWKSAG